jgi:GDP-4-dehydro-6-deoxy-D-mannose reductase
MFERILVTGCSGFIGRWTIAELRRQFPHASLYGAGRGQTPTGPQASAPDHHVQLDLSSPEQIDAAVAMVRPDALVHLASLKLAPFDELLTVNVSGSERLLTALSRTVPEARIVVIGSSAELGRVSGLDLPLDEETPCQPVDLYGVTKLAQAAVAGRHALHGRNVVRLRLFNVFGPLAPDTSLPGRCVQLLRDAARAGGAVELKFGPLEARRDYVDVRDIARAIALALQRGQSGALYHIGSGVSRGGHELVNALIAESGLANVTFREAASRQPPLVPWQTADNARAWDALEWQPAVGWLQSIRDMWAFAQVSRGPIALAGAQ